MDILLSSSGPCKLCKSKADLKSLRAMDLELVAIISVAAHERDLKKSPKRDQKRPSFETKRDY